MGAYEIVTIIVKDVRISVEKSKLMEKVHYFEALFSGNYADSNKTEYKVPNDSWSVRSIKDLVQWVRSNNDSVNSQNIYTFYDTIFAELDRITELIEVAHYYVITNLLDDITYSIVTSRLNSQTGLYFWQFSRKYPLLKLLKDTAYALCLRQFKKLNVSDIKALCFNDFIELIGNANLKCGKRYLSYIMLIWYKHNSSKYNIKSDEYDLLTMVVLNEKRNAEVQQCLAINQKDSAQDEVTLLIWNGIDISSRTIPSKKPSKKTIVGCKLIAQDFDIFYIEEQITNNYYLTSVWKYSLIFKHWIFVTSKKSPTRYMNVLLMRTRLYFIACILRPHVEDIWRIRETVYYDIDTASWSNVCNVKSYFNKYTVNYGKFNGKSYHNISLFHYQDLVTKEDYSTLISPFHFEIARINATLCFRDQFLCSAYSQQDEPKIWNINFKTKEDNVSNLPFPLLSMTTRGDEIIGFTYFSNEVLVTVGYLDLANTYQLKHIIEKKMDHLNLETHTTKKILGCFNFIDPDSLYKMVPKIMDIANLISC